MRRISLSLAGGALPVVAVIAMTAVLATTLGFIDWSTPPGGGQRGALEIAGVPLLPGAGARVGRTARAVARPPGTTTSRGTTRLVAVRTGGTSRPSAQGHVPSAPSGATPVSGQGGGATPVGGTPGTTPGGGPSGGAGSGSGGGTGSGDVAPAPTDPATTRSAPLAGVGTIVAVAAENTTQAVGMTVDRLTAGVGPALGPLHRTVATLGAGVDAIATQVGRAAGQIVRNVTGAPPR